MMKTIHKIENIRFDNDTMSLTIDNLNISVRLSDISAKLSSASDSIRNDFRLSPSGYGIHWNQIDEDLSVDGLIKKSSKPIESKRPTRERV